MYPFYALHDYYIYLLKKIFVSTDRLGPFAVTRTTTARGAGAQEQAPTAQAGSQPSPGTCPSSRPDGNRIDRLRPVPRPGSSSRSSFPPHPTSTTHATRPHHTTTNPQLLPFVNWSTAPIHSPPPPPPSAATLRLPNSNASSRAPPIPKASIDPQRLMVFSAAASPLAATAASSSCAARLRCCCRVGC